MDTSISICQLTTSDIAKMREMLGVLGRAFNEVHTYAEKQPSSRYLKSMLSNENFIALAAFSGVQIIGGLAAYVLQKFEQERTEIYIYDIAVAEEYRRRGVASRLIETLKKIASQRGAYVIFVQADRGDDPAIALYTKFGPPE